VKRTLVVAAAVAALALAALRSFSLEDDPIGALVHPDPAAAALFERYQSRSPFKGRVFLATDALSPAERDGLEGALRAAGYVEEPAFAPPAPAALLALAPLLPAADLERLLSEPALAARADEALALAALPAGEAALALVQADPAGLGPALLARLGAGGGGGAGRVRVFRSPSPLAYEAVEAVHDRLLALGDRVGFVGADFFAVENWRAARRDMAVCSILSLVLNLALFWAFARRWALVALLAAGSVVSYLAGLLAVRAFYPQVYGLVLAYTSTFVGFNNESLVHLSGLPRGRRGAALLGVWSAIGTTFIGFVVLLLGRTVMVRQMALASLGGLVGFLLFLWPYRATLRALRFRAISWPKVTVRARAVTAVCAASVLAVAAVGIPQVRTRVEAFRYASPALEAQAERFSRRLEALSVENVVALPVEGSPRAALARLGAEGLADPARHPLAAWRPPADQEASIAVLRDRLGPAAARMRALLAERGLAVEPSAPAPPAAPLGEWELLDAVGRLAPVRWADAEGGRRFLFVGLRPGATAAQAGALVSLSPRHHYDDLLTAFSRELGVLFLVGLGAMALYLALLQRRPARVLYVFAPLFVFAAGFAAWARLAGATVTIVHVMGFSLVIALAMDYTAVAVSSDHADEEASKVLLTGLSTLATFGVLVLAEHPVLRSLGAVVAAGCGLALAIALFVRLAPGRAGRAAPDERARRGEAA
jgi:hypothetical protein